MGNTKFNGYEILEILPRGGMSTVYKARQLSLDRIVAIKALPPTMGVDPADVEKFMAEARITAGLKHQNIVQVYDFGKSDSGVYYFVMEYISGYSVAAWIRRKRYLSEENSLLCALSISSAMKYAWQKAGIVHCDIKPDNVIIDGDGTVKVADLGLATSVKSISGWTRTKDNCVFGTPNYISPEQSRGDEKLDCRADIYSLGAMLYHCMTGTMPFEAIPPLEVMDRQITDQIPDAQDVNPSISIWSACLIEKMMAKNPADRQKDWEETIRDLSNARSEMMPQGILSPEIASTVRRSATRENRVREYLQSQVIKDQKHAVSKHTESPATIKKRLPGGLLQKTLAIAAGVALLVTVSWSVLNLLKEFRAKTGLGTLEATNVIQSLESALPESGPGASDSRDDRERKALEKYKQTMAWLKENPAGLNEAVTRFTKLAEETRGTAYSDLARQELRKLDRVAAEMKTVLAALDKSAAAPAARNRFLEAAAVYEKYHGPYEKEIAADRKRKALYYQARQAAWLENERRLSRQTSERQLAHAADEIGMIIVEDDISAGRLQNKRMISKASSG
jgi:serine/threonine-protein kinase